MFHFCVSSICLFSIQVCPHRLSRAVHQHFFSRLTCAQFNDSITCLANTYFILVCTDYYIFAILLILIYKCLNHLNFLFLAGQPTKRAHQYPMWMGDGMGGLPRALWKSHWEPATIPPPSSSTISHTNISFTTHQTLSSISYTANSHAHSHTTDHLHHTNTTTPTTTFITPTPPHQLQVLSPLTHPSHPPNNHAWKRQKKSARTTSTASTTTTSITMSINMSAPTILPKKQLSRRTKQSAQITIPKKHPPTLSPLFQLISG